MLIWILFWLSVAMIPLDVWLHRWIPPITWSNTSAANASGSWLFGLIAIVVRFLLQLPVVLALDGRSLAPALPSGLWLVLSLALFVAVEVALGLLHKAWMNRATADRPSPRVVRLLGWGYFAGLAVQSAVLYWLLRAAGDAA